jgi:hypothetical protein
MSDMDSSELRNAGPYTCCPICGAATGVAPQAGHRCREKVLRQIDAMRGRHDVDMEDCDPPRVPESQRISDGAFIMGLSEYNYD